MAGIKSLSTTAANNTALFPEEQAASSVNDNLRQHLADLATDYRDREWTEYGAGTGAGDGSTDYDMSYENASRFRISGGDYTAAYHVGRAIRITGASTGTIYGVITASEAIDADPDYTLVDFSSSGALLAEGGLRVWLSTLSADGRALPIAAVNGRPIDMEGEALTAPTLTGYAEGRQTLTISSGTVAWDLSQGNVGYLKLTEDVTAITISNWPGNPKAGSATLWVQQDATGGWSMTGWPSAVHWLGGDVAPTFSLNAHTLDIVLLLSLDAGASIVGSYGQNAPFTGAVG